MVNYGNLQVSDVVLTRIACGITQLSSGLCDLMDVTKNNVFTIDPHRTREENAADWVNRHYDVVAGTALLITGASEILSDALSNGDLILAEESRV